MKYKKGILVLSLIFILTFSFAVSAGPQDKIRNMNFKNAETVDVLRAIAEVANVNLITDSAVSGTTTVHLRDITFQKALDLITQTRGLTYKWDENTIVVAPPERIDEIYANIVTEFVPVSSNNIDNISVIIKDIFPDTQITVDNLRRQFILQGEEARVNKVVEMITRLDTTGTNQGTTSSAPGVAGQETQVVEEEFYTESYQVVNAGLSDIEEKLKQVNYNLDIRTNLLTDTLTISGREKDVKEAMSMAKTYDESLEPATRVVRVDYIDTEQISEIVGKFYPNIQLHVNQKRKEIIINGAKNKLNGVVQLVKEINVPQQQVIIETRVEEISTDELKELGVDLDDGSLSKIHFIKDQPDPDEPDEGEYGQIDGIELTWPNFFKALENSSVSKTLANPRLMTLNGEEAKMSIVDEVPSPNFDEDGDIQSYDYERAGIELTFTPWITENNEIELQITPSVSSFGADPGGLEPPPRKTRSVNTRLRLKNGETFAIGGLIQEEDREAMSKVPFLGDIPIIGEIFKSRNDDNTRSELIIFVTPRIIKYGENIEKSDHLISTGLESEEEIEVENAELVTEDTAAEATQEEAVVEDKGKTKEEILEEYKNKEKEDTGFQGLTDEELQEILNK
jgi:general secretion pathway protein D